MRAVRSGAPCAGTAGRPDRLAGAAGCCDGRPRLPWHPAAVRVERSRLDVPSARPASTGLALPAEDGRLWPGGKRAGWNRGHDLATGAPLNRAARDSETRRRLAAGESVPDVARPLRPGYRAAGAVGGINAGSAPSGVWLRPGILGLCGAVTVAGVATPTPKQPG